MSEDQTRRLARKVVGKQAADFDEEFRMLDMLDLL